MILSPGLPGARLRPRPPVRNRSGPGPPGPAGPCVRDSAAHCYAIQNPFQEESKPFQQIVAPCTVMSKAGSINPPRRLGVSVRSSTRSQVTLKRSDCQCGRGYQARKNRSGPGSGPTVSP